MFNVEPGGDFRIHQCLHLIGALHQRGERATSQQCVHFEILLDHTGHVRAAAKTTREFSLVNSKLLHLLQISIHKEAKIFRIHSLVHLLHKLLDGSLLVQIFLLIKILQERIDKLDHHF